MADLDYGELRLFPGNYDEYMTAATQPASAAVGQRQEESADRRTASLRQPLLGQRLQGQAGHQPRQARSTRSSWPRSSRPAVSARSSASSRQEAAPPGGDPRERGQGFDGKPLFKDFSLQVEAGERIAIIGPNGIGKTTLLRTWSVMRPSPAR
jgi:ATPase subunit of ABC transporter with duplicated ATPase domains